jgi:hypothetical protein
LENGSSKRRKSSSGKEAEIKAKERMKKATDSVSRADYYCNLIRNRELVLTAEGEKIRLVMTSDAKDRLGRTKKEEQPLPFVLAKRMTAYQSLRDTSLPRLPKNSSIQYYLPSLRSRIKSRLEDRALDLLEIIDQAITSGAFEEPKVTERLQKLEHEKDELEKTVDKLKKENEELHDKLKRFGKVGFVSDVSENKGDDT